MSTGTKLEAALSEITDGNIWPFVCPLEIEPDMWITYFPEKEQPVDYGDGVSQEWMFSWQVHWFAKGTQDYMNIRKDIRSALEEAGFSVTSILYSFEQDTKIMHLVFFSSSQSV